MKWRLGGLFQLVSAGAAEAPEEEAEPGLRWDRVGEDRTAMSTGLSRASHQRRAIQWGED